MEAYRTQSTSQEPDVRAAIAQHLTEQGGTVIQDGPGSLVVDVGGSVATAYLAGGFRNMMKMPQRVTIATVGGEGGTGLSIEVTSRGTGSGAMSGGLLGASKQGKAEKAWMNMVLSTIPNRLA